MKHITDNVEQEKINKVYELRDQGLSKDKIAAQTGFNSNYVYKHMRQWDLDNKKLIAQRKKALEKNILSLSKQGIPAYKIAELVGVERRNALRIINNSKAAKIVYSNCKAIEKDLAEVFAQKNGISQREYKAIIELHMIVKKGHELYKTKLSETMKNTKTKFKRKTTQKRLGLDSKHIIWIPDHLYGRSVFEMKKIQELTNEILKDREEMQEKLRKEALLYTQNENFKIKEKIQDISQFKDGQQEEFNSSVLSFNNTIKSMDNTREPWFARNNKKAEIKAVEYAEYKQNLKNAISA